MSNFICISILLLDLKVFELEVAVAHKYYQTILLISIFGSTALEFLSYFMNYFQFYMLSCLPIIDTYVVSPFLLLTISSGISLSKNKRKSIS